MSSEKKGPQAIGRSRWWNTTKIHMITAWTDVWIVFSLTEWQWSDYSHGVSLIEAHNFDAYVNYLAMDRGYSSYDIHSICQSSWVIAVVPPKKNMKTPWEYNKNIYAFRNEVERFFHRLKSSRRIATRYDKLDTMYSWFVTLGMIKLILKSLC